MIRLTWFFGVLAAAQIVFLIWRGSPIVQSDVGPGGDLRYPLIATLFAIPVLLVMLHFRLPLLAGGLFSGFWLLIITLLVLEALAGKPLIY
ncbi:hypothetical protein [uncultured Paludibaculum sp.]|uniref:hypothetical protein n=1 Tax=uncultured Paludibaculum sp. TaxID=1765020 RepID=UPI002AAA89B8|nr:hypothetical protein [uncultured Paludibaculum sp.]